VVPDSSQYDPEGTMLLPWQDIQFRVRFTGYHLSCSSSSCAALQSLTLELLMTANVRGASRYVPTWNGRGAGARQIAPFVITEYCAETAAAGAQSLEQRVSRPCAFFMLCGSD